MLKGNRGDWSEIYVLLKLLADGEIYGGDKDLNKLPHLQLTVTGILRKEENRKKKVRREYQYVIGDDSVEVQDLHGNTVASVSRADLTLQASDLLKSIQTAKGRAFTVSDTEAFISGIFCSQLKAKSSDKADIRLVIHDHRSGMEHLLGFSIKSKLGSSSSLINASKTTNFRYRIENLTLSDKEIASWNTAYEKQVKRLVKRIFSEGGNVAFDSVENTVFESNLVLVDSRLPDLLADLLQVYYTSDVSQVSKLAEIVKARNPLAFNFSLGHDFYAYKLKKYFTESALGLLPGKVWSGIYHASGGYIIVKQDGDVLCYHVYHRNTLEDYLYNNTRFETPSTKRHGFGRIFKENEQLYILLNLQVRFL